MTPLCFAVGPDHNLAQQQSTSVEQLVSHPAVLPTKGTYTRTLLEQSINDRQLSVNCTLATDYLETLKMMTSIGLGWSLLPEILLEEGQILKLEVPELQLSRSLGIVTHRKRTLSNVANAMRSAAAGTEQSSGRLAGTLADPFGKEKFNLYLGGIGTIGSMHSILINRLGEIGANGA